VKKPKRAKATLERFERGIAAVGKNKPFLLVYYGSDHAGGWQQLNRPLRTITTVDRFAIVKPDPEHGHVMRMLQVPELQAAMGMPSKMKFEAGTRRDRIRMIGNAVCPNVMREVIKGLIRADTTQTEIPKFPTEQDEGSRLRPRARLLRTLGQELISNEVAAVIELVKNAYDADATRVLVQFASPLEIGKGKIEVLDNGHGMPLEIVRTVWMEPATPSKRSNEGARSLSVAIWVRRVLAARDIASRQ